MENALVASGFDVPSFTLEHPSDSSLGDYASNVAFVLGKEIKKNPRELAERLVQSIKEGCPEEVESVDVAGSGFINFHLTRKFFAEQVEEIVRRGESWGRNENLKDKKIMVEHSQPNPFKPFHIGHLMSNTIGESIFRLVTFAGAEARCVNYQGDVGLHVAKALWGLKELDLDPNNVDDLGRAYVYGSEQYEKSDNAKKDIIELNKKVYAKDAEVQSAYNTGRDASLKHFEKLYELLGSRFDHLFFEGEVWETGLQLVERGLKEGIFEKSENAVIFRGERYGLHTRVFVTGGGVPTYEAKDLGLAEKKHEYFPFDVSITITAVEQKQYFKVVFKAYELLYPKQKSRLIHISHGMMQFSSGKMSSRKGNIITGESLLSEVQKKALALSGKLPAIEQKEVADKVSVAAVKYSVLKQSLGKDIVFDEKRALSFEGDSGPYLQYAHMRALSVLKKAKLEGVEPSATHVTQSIPELERLVYRFEEVVKRAQEEYEPHYVATYLKELSGAFNSWYAQEKILDKTLEAPYRLLLTKATALTLKNGLWLLGIKAPERM